MALIKFDSKKPPHVPKPAVEHTTEDEGYDGLTLVGEIDGRKLYIEDES